MKKLFFILSILTMSSLSAFAYEGTLVGRINYDVNSAREEAFEGVFYNIPKDSVKSLIYDKKFDENQNALKNNIALKDRDLKLYNMQHFKSYGVEYVNDKKYTYFYWYNSGFLKAVAIDQSKKPGEYPQKLYYYDAKGELVNVNFIISKNEEYIYNKDGTLNCHWVNGEAYDSKGKKVGASEQIVDDL